MADQQDQSSSGGSVEKASASTDTSKSKGKSSSSGGSSGYRKRHNNNVVQATLEEKRRRQNTTGELQPPQALSQKHQRPVESSKAEGRSRNERRTNGAGLECLFGELTIPLTLFKSFNRSTDFQKDQLLIL